MQHLSRLRIFACLFGVATLYATAPKAAVESGVKPIRSEQKENYPRTTRDGGSANHVYGFRFIVLKTGRITHLGGLFPGVKTVVLVDNERKRVIGHAKVNGSMRQWRYEPISGGFARVVAGRSYSVAARMGTNNGGAMVRSFNMPTRIDDIIVLGSELSYATTKNHNRWGRNLKLTNKDVMRGLVDFRFTTNGDGSGSSSSSSGGSSSSSSSSSSGGGSSSSGSSGGSSSGGAVSYRRESNRLIVTSTKPPTFKLEFSIGSGAPGGGTATGLYIPATSSRSIVEGTPHRNCCSGLGLDNLEWRWRPFGGGSGTRAALGLSSQVRSFKILSQSRQRLVFELTGSWTGVSRFTRRTTVTPDGFSTALQADYSGTTGKDSMWWLITLFHDNELLSNSVTIQDRDTGPTRLNKTTIGTPLPSSITMPYTIKYPLAGRNHTIALTMNTLADHSGGARFYEFFDHGNPHGINIGPYYLIYPRWTSVFARRTYDFNYSWKLSR